MIVEIDAHHVVAKTWKRLTEHYARALLLGLTAIAAARVTASRWADIFDSMCDQRNGPRAHRSRASARRELSLRTARDADRQPWPPSRRCAAYRKHADADRPSSSARPSPTLK